VVGGMWRLTGVVSAFTAFLIFEEPFVMYL
jgi:hypothetical protein